MPADRQLLYISPYFPPLARVGALRPLKFCRHLQALGWVPRVLCDFHPGYELDATLLDAIPRGVAVHRSYSRGARRAALDRLPAPGARLSPRAPRPHFPNENLWPLGHHTLDVPHALAEGTRILRAHPCQAILVNADPFAGLLVGSRLSRRFGIPWVADLRDPWAPCELRRPQRPPPQRAIIDALEAHLVRHASAVILNTEGAARAYRARYPKLRAKFSVLRNHVDPELTAGPSPIAFDRFTVLFAGSFRPYLERPLTELLAALKRCGVGSDVLQLALPGATAAALGPAARARGVGDYLLGFAHVPYRRTGGLLRAADLLLSVSPPSSQRVPAKLYEYLAAPRPLLAMGDDSELRSLLRGVDRATPVRLHDTAAAARAVIAALAAGRQQHVARSVSHGSREATRQLVALLDRVAAVTPEVPGMSLSHERQVA